MNFTGDISKAFCFEILGVAAEGPITYKHVDLDTFGPKSLYVRMHYSANYANLVTDDDYAAFQMLLWEIVDEGWNANDLNELLFNYGAVQFHNIDPGIAQAWYDQLDNLQYGTWIGGIDVWENPDSQNIITIVPGPSVALAGLIGLAGIRRRRRN